MQVSVAEESREAYQKETGRDGTQPLLSIPVQLKQGITKSKQTAEQTSEPQNSGLTQQLTAALEGLPTPVRDIVLAAAVVIGAIVLLLVLLFLLGLYRRIKKRGQMEHPIKK